MASRGEHTKCPHCRSTDVEYFPGEPIFVEDEDGEPGEANHTCNKCGHNFYESPDRYNAVFCPECGSGATEPSRGVNRFWCDECGTTFTHTPKPRKPQKARADILKQAFESKAPSLGIPLDFFGRTTSARGVTWEVCGLNPRSSKMPIVLREQGGKRELRASASWLAKQLGAPLTKSPEDSRTDAAAVELAKRGPGLGIDPSYAGRIFVVNGKRVQLLGLIPRVQKMPVRLQVVEDRSYRKCTVEYFLRYISSIEPVSTDSQLPYATMPAEPTPPPCPAEVPIAEVICAPPAPANTQLPADCALPQRSAASTPEPQIVVPPISPAEQALKSETEEFAKKCEQMALRFDCY